MRDHSFFFSWFVLRDQVEESDPQQESLVLVLAFPYPF